MAKSNKHIGSSFDDWLDDEGINEEVQAIAVKRVIAWELEQYMKKKRLSKVKMTEQLGTSRTQLDRLLDPHATSVTLKTLTRAANVMGKKLSIELVTP